MAPGAALTMEKRMTTTTPTRPALTSPKPLMEQALLTRLTEDGPTSMEVATIELHKELKTLYPDLNLDLDKTVVGTPIWDFVDDELTCIDIQYQRLPQVLVQLSLDHTKVNYLQGEHFLTQHPSTQNPIQLPVNIERIATLLNDLASVFFVAFKEHQLGFWNAVGTRLPRWQELADGLAAALNIQEVEGWSRDQCDIARGISMYPDKQQRLIHRPDLAGIQVYMLDIDTPSDSALKHLLLAGTAVIQGTFNQTDILMMYTIEYGYETFASLQELVESVQSRLSASMSTIPLSIRLVEPEGNFFDHMAWALIATELNAIETEGFTDPVPAETLATSEPSADIDPEAKRLNMLVGGLPAWLHDASPQDLNAYSQHMLELSTLYSDMPANLFQIQSIKTFAQEKMRNAIIADKKNLGADKLPLDELHITLTEPITAGPFTLPNPLESYTQTLGDYALSNTPPYLATVSFQKGEKVPEWLTDSYLTQISEQVDIGKVYPALIKEKLMDDPFEAPRQKQFYIQQLRSLLPLLAMECKLTQKGNVDEQGYRYIRELVNPTPGTADPIVIRPLSMRPGHRFPRTFDDVLNMFIIGPRAAEKGPCLLYRPLLENPLIQFPSLQNLNYELHQSGEVRDSILAWLPNRQLSFNYSQYVFPSGLPSPWMIADVLSTPLKVLEWGGSPVFSETELTGDIFAALFDANAKAMAALADRASLSNAERRWTLLQDSGWAVFDAASNFLNGYAAAAVWVWQIFNQLQQALDAHEQGSSLIKWQRLGDVLMALAIVIAHKAGPLRRGKATSSAPTRPKLPLPHTPRMRASASGSGALPHSQFSTLSVEGAVPRRTPDQMATYLDAFKVEAPDLGELSTSQQLPRLYDNAQTTYAQVDQRWFQVVGDEEANIHILDPANPSQTGPSLEKTALGTWRINTNLRLLRSGESLKSKLKAARALKARNREALEQQRAALEHSEEALRAQMNTLLKAPITVEMMNQSLANAESLISNRQEALKLLEDWRGSGGTTGYENDLLNLYDRYNTYLMTWTAFKHVSYNAVVKRILKNRESEDMATRQQLLEDINLATKAGRDIDSKLNAMAVAKDKLAGMGASGAMSARMIALSEHFHSRWELKTNEIANAAELCIREQAAVDMADARSAVYTVVERATLASRTMMQMLKEEPQETQLETLAALVEEFLSINHQIDELPTDFPDRVDPDALQSLKGVLADFRLLAQGNIGKRLQQDAEAAPSGHKPVRSSTSRPYQKPRVVKTRPRHLPQKPTDVPKQEPLILIQPLKKQAQQQSSDYIEITSKGLELINTVDTFVRATKRSALKPYRIPADMQEIFDQQALKLEQTLATFEPLHAKAKLAGNALPVADLPVALREGATQLRREGVNIRAEIIKQRKPQQGYFQWLHDNKQVRITRNEAGRIKTQQFNDYFQEYWVLDSTNNDKPLWLAHFHYPTLKTPARQFTAAHLKIDEKYLKTLSADQQKELENRSALDNSLRKLNDPVALAAFLALEPRGN